MGATVQVTFILKKKKKRVAAVVLIVHYRAIFHIEMRYILTCVKSKQQQTFLKEEKEKKKSIDMDIHNFSVKHML